MKPLSAFCRQFLGPGFAMLLLSACVAMGHPNHDAIAEADWNSETGSLEISLQVNAHELERAVSKAAGKSLDLDDEESTEHLQRYIAAKVRCLDPDGKAVDMRWVGAEIKVRSAWVYFEFPLGKQSEDAIRECSLANTVFFDEYEDQKNTVALRLHADESRCFLRFSKDQPTAKLRPAKPKSRPAELTTKDE